jgi:hypothetical protein
MRGAGRAASRWGALAVVAAATVAAACFHPLWRTDSRPAAATTAVAQAPAATPTSAAAVPPPVAAVTPAAPPTPIPPGALALWSGRLDLHPALARHRFYFLMMTSGVASGGANEVETQYRDYLSRTQKVGISIPILYMRTTRGAAGDWAFDPDFDTRLLCGTRQVAEDNLSGVIRYAVEHRLPVQFILNGGIWADASCETPQWDLTDHLEQDAANCQWTQGNEVFPDDYLKGLNGSTSSPELARSLTYNVYAANVRRYKKRNLQAAARVVATFARAHPDLFVGIALDADTYMNPFFRGREAFDYNPGMLRQFREWLRGSGPYAGHSAAGAPDLTTYRRARPMTLAEVDKVAGAHWKSWNDVEPPRRLPGFVDPQAPGERAIWDDPWWNLWDAFRKHIVDLHYDELSSWAHAAGISRERIFSAQGLVHNDPALPPFAVRVNSSSPPYDSAGVSVEGAIPRDGHLGAILYGRTARNAVTLENGHSLFATIGRMDDGWAIVEYNNTDLRFPTKRPDYAMAYQTFRDAFNYGAREVSAMAWNGSNGLYADNPAYVPYTSWRNTPAEAAMRDFLVTHADLPWGARLWTFGSAIHVDADGWSSGRGTVTAGAGFITLKPEQGDVTLLSPPDQVIRPLQLATLVLRFDADAKPVRLTVAARAGASGAWRDVGTTTGSELALAWPADWRNDRTIVERLKISMRFADDVHASTLSRVLLYPASPLTRTSPKMK